MAVAKRGSRSLATAFVLCILSVLVRGQTCYWRRQDQVIFKDHGDWFACNNTATHNGGAELCCRNDSECGESSICKAPDEGENGSQWYVGGCTDKSYTDPICRKSCTGDQQTWITWSDSRNRWDCCGDYGCNEASGSTDTFRGVSPAKWSAIPTTSESGGLSTAAMAGIGVGAGVILIAIIAGLVVFLLRRRRRRSKAKSKQPVGGPGRYAQIRDPAGQEQPLTTYEGAPNRPTSPLPGYNDLPPTNPAEQAASMYPEQLKTAAARRSPSPSR